MILRWRHTPVSTRKARELTVTSEDVADLVAEKRVLGKRQWPLLLFKLMEQEPSFASSGSLDPNTGRWTKWIPREVYEYEGVTRIEGYVARVERLTAFPEAQPLLATP